MVTITSVDEAEHSDAIEGFDLAQIGANESMSIQYFEYEPGSKIDVHSHPQEQIGYVYRGNLTLTIGGETYECGPEEAYILESNEPHGGENFGDEPVVGVDIFSPPRGNPKWID